MNTEKKIVTETDTNIEEISKYNITISELISVVLNKLWVLILVGLAAAVGAYFFTVNFSTPTYKSTARVYILNRQSSMSTSINDLNSAVTIKEDFQVLIRSNEVYREVLRTIGEDPANYRSLGGQLSLDNNTSRFVDITITDRDPVRAKLIVDAFANVSRVKAKEIMGVEDITIEEYGEISTSPTDPSMRNNIILAAFAGVVLSAAVVLIVHLMNDKVRTEEDLEKALGVCVLGSIPDVSMLRKVKKVKSTNKKKARK